MPLPPSGRTPWPPDSVTAAYKRYETLAAWYGGDPDVLAAHYHGNTQTGVDLKYRTSQFQGGLIGAVARMFWGSPPPVGELRTKSHLPLASDIATMSADLLFAEPPKIKLDDPKAQERLELILEEAEFQSTLIEGGEVSSALGDVYLVGAWDKAVRGTPWLRAVHADAAIPEWRMGNLTALTVWCTIPTGDKRTWRHLERHEAGRILNGLYRGDATDLGVSVPLQSLPDTEHLVPEWATGMDALTAVHVPNMRPNRLNRGSPLGRSDFSPGTIQAMDQLDETWSSLGREFRLAKARLIATQDALRPLGPGQGSMVEIDREIFVPLNIDPSKVTGDPVRLIQPLIRVDDHLKAATAITEQIIRASGYSLASFGADTSGAAATAEEIRQRNHLSYLTRGKKCIYWARLGKALEMLLALDVAVFDSKITPGRPTVDFADQVAESDSATAATLATLEQAQAVSTQMKVTILHPDWDQGEVMEEVARIHADKGLGPVPNPEAAVRQTVTLTGHGQAGPEDPTGAPTEDPQAMPAT